ncbi:MAG TPA: hypothetical protein VMV86_06425 [Methanosarcinales archaeon]|nr:hypothetical protein [Methanosarcinales archaeon]
MANRILTAEGWEARIQSIMGVNLAYLPNTDIGQPDIITVAEANIIAQIPDYAALTDDDKVYLEAAVVAECSILLCPSMAARLPKKEQGPHETHELDIDWNKKKADFEVERDGYVGKILPPSTLLHFGLSQ